MDQEIRDDYLIVVSAVVAILASKIADGILEAAIDLSFIGNSGIESILEFIIKLAILIVLVYLILVLVKWLTKKTLFK